MKEITPHTSIIVCADEETMASVLDRLQPYQKAIITAPKYSAISGARKAINAPPWRHIGELGEIAYMEDGSRRWTLKGDWETMKIFLVYMANGDVQTHFAYIDGDDGMLRDCNGDDVGWLWCDAEYFMDVPKRPSLVVHSGSSLGDLANNWEAAGFHDVAEVVHSLHNISKSPANEE